MIVVFAAAGIMVMQMRMVFVMLRIQVPMERLPSVSEVPAKQALPSIMMQLLKSWDINSW